MNRLLAEKTSKTVAEASGTLIMTLKYLYAASYEDFYNVSAKDIFKVALSDITEGKALPYLAIKTDKERLGYAESESFERLADLARCAFAARLPFLRRNIVKCPLGMGEIKLAYQLCVKDAPYTDADLCGESYKNSVRLLRWKKPEPRFSSDWFGNALFNNCKELVSDGNRGLYLMGCADSLIPLYYTALTEKISARLCET